MTIELIKRKIIYKNAALLIFWLGMLGLKLVFKDDFPINAGFSMGWLLGFGVILVWEIGKYLRKRSGI